MGVRFMKNEYIIKNGYVEIIINSRRHGKIITVIDEIDLLKAQQAGAWWIHYSEDINSYYVEGVVNGKYTRLHHHLLDVKQIDKYVDHINHDTLDNRRSNLNVVTNAENQQNRRLGKDNTSGHTGVSWRKDKKQWQARISVDKKEKHLGYFDDKEQAIDARKTAEKEYFHYKQTIA